MRDSVKPFLTAIFHKSLLFSHAVTVARTGLIFFSIKSVPMEMVQATLVNVTVLFTCPCLSNDLLALV